MPCLLVKGIFHKTISGDRKKGKSSGLSKAEILNACHGKVDGFYEPDKYEHRYKVVVHNTVACNQISPLNPPESPFDKGGIFSKEGEGDYRMEQIIIKLRNV